jgi:hypothetical protein
MKFEVDIAAATERHRGSEIGIGSSYATARSGETVEAIIQVPVLEGYKCCFGAGTLGSKSWAVRGIRTSWPCS